MYVVFKQKHSDLRILEDFFLQFTINNSKKIRPYELQSFLLIFGNLISSISISSDHSFDYKYRGPKTKQAMFNLLNVITKHSLESLTSINIEHMENGWLREFSKPLPQVKSASFTTYPHRSDESPMVSDIFPNLSYLDFASIDSTSTQIIGHFPYLKTLEFQVCYKNENEFKHLLELNSQLSSLIVCFDSYDNGTSTMLRFIEEKLQLEKLELRLYLVEIRSQEVVHFKNLKNFEYVCQTEYLKFKFPFSFDQLEELTMYIWVEDKNRAKWIKEIDKIIKKMLN